MKKLLLKMTSMLALGFVCFGHFSCHDKCEAIRTYRTQVPVTVLLKDLPKTITIEAAQELVSPGKIYAKDNYLFITEAGKGIHVVDNSNPAKPTNLSFIKVGGNGDMAIKDNILYIDNYVDLVALDISNPKSIKESGRLSAAFANSIVNYGGWYYNPQNQTVVYYEDKIVTDTVETNCGAGGYIGPVYYESLAYKNAGVAQGSGGVGGPTAGSTGKGGSMARFTIYDDYIYVASNTDLLVYDIKTPTQPKSRNKVNLGWGIETIYPYNDKLFIGSTTGMFIFDNKNPENPVKLSNFQHARACDPVVVNGDIAYVTLRTGNTCGNAPNQLQVVDVKDLTKPVLIKTYQMQNPHGLGVDFPNLFICEGEFGLKSMDAKNANDIKVLQQIDKINAYDVIPLDGKHLIMVGKDGLYQYDYTDPKNLKQLSVIPIKKS
ncbi:MAG: LVIVD repeat-containing protein [Spirosomataceae bacterium]